MNSDTDLKLTAIIPAAGQSRRMGQPKLLMHVAGRAVIDHLLDALNRSGIESVAVLVRPGDVDLRRHLARREQVKLVVPESPPSDMRASVQRLLQELKPNHKGGWILIPADSPWIEPQILQQLIECWKTRPDSIVVPTFRGRRGHPTLFPASLADEIETIPVDQGLNYVLRSQPERVWEVACESESVVTDLDTPDDVMRLQAVWLQTHAD